jgi:hypothetical protein
MFETTGNTPTATTTTWKVVLPFYGYAGLSFFVATLVLVLSANGIIIHYFHPHALAITHIMALGWGTMIILGASHQLVPVLIEGRLYSIKLAHASFLFAAFGIPLLCYGFFVFDMGWPAKWGGRFVMLSIILYIINLGKSMSGARKGNVHAIFVFTAALWLLATATVGLVLVYNFTYRLVPGDSMEYLPLHAHVGVVGWFLLLVIGVASRLIPMFLISKYQHPRMLWWIYGLINTGLISFIFIFLYGDRRVMIILPLLAVAAAIVLFALYCYRCYRQRIRKKVDEPMKISLLSVLMMLLPLVFLVVIIILLILTPAEQTRLLISYGFIIFFGWITAIILGMTFKTLPFIVWNKVYHQLAGQGKTPGPRELFSARVFNWMSLSYMSGFVLFTSGILFQHAVVLQVAAVLLLVTSFLYNWNLVKLLMHKPVRR